MTTVEESIQALTSAVLDQARTETEQILADSKADAETIRQRAQEQAVAEASAILTRAAEEADRIRSQALATTRLKAHTLQLERREKLLDSTFVSARQQLPAVQQWPDYDQIALQLLREALLHLETDAALVRADKQTEQRLTDQVLDDLAQELGIQIERGDTLQEGVGVVVQTIDGHRQYDNTLETRLSRLQNSLRSMVYHLLMGESL